MKKTDVLCFSIFLPVFFFRRKKGRKMKEWVEFSSTAEIAKLRCVTSRMFLPLRYIYFYKQGSFVIETPRVFEKEREKSFLSHVTYNSNTMLSQSETHPVMPTKRASFADVSLNRLRMHRTRCYRIEIFQKCNRPYPKKITWKIIGLSSLYTWEIHYLHFPSRKRSLFLVLIITQLACVLTLAKIMLA